MLQTLRRKSPIYTSDDFKGWVDLMRKKSVDDLLASPRIELKTFSMRNKTATAVAYFTIILLLYIILFDYIYVLLLYTRTKSRVQYQ